MSDDKDLILHIYPQQFNHGEAYLVGDVQALIGLRDAINRALEDGKASTTVFANDGEGYNVIILKRASADFEELMLPYAFPNAGWVGIGKHPFELLDRVDYQQLMKSTLGETT